MDSTDNQKSYRIRLNEPIHIQKTFTEANELENLKVEISASQDAVGYVNEKDDDEDDDGDDNDDKGRCSKPNSIPEASISVKEDSSVSEELPRKVLLDIKDYGDLDVARTATHALYLHKSIADIIGNVSNVDRPRNNSSVHPLLLKELEAALDRNNTFYWAKIALSALDEASLDVNSAAPVECLLDQIYKHFNYLDFVLPFSESVSQYTRLARKTAICRLVVYHYLDKTLMSFITSVKVLSQQAAKLSYQSTLTPLVLHLFPTATQKLVWP